MFKKHKLQIESIFFFLPSVKPLPLSPLEPQSYTLALELRVREVEEENRALRKELSQPPRSPTHGNQYGNGRHGNQSHAGREGLRHAEAHRAITLGNSTDCVSQPVVDKCEVRHGLDLQD